METTKLYTMPPLPFDYKALEPFISEQQLTIHYQKHHQAYVNGANAILEKLDKSRKEGSDLDLKAISKELSWNVGGHIMHSLFWANLAPKGMGGGVPTGKIAEMIKGEFGSFERFKKEFTQAASTVEGSGWGALCLCKKTGRPLIMQVEKHNVNVYPSYPILLIIDVFEHAYYLDYKNDRTKFIEAFWNLVNWEEVNNRVPK